MLQSILLAKTGKMLCQADSDSRQYMEIADSNVKMNSIWKFAYA